MYKFKKIFTGKVLAIVLIACSIIFSFFIGTSFHKTSAVEDEYWSNITLNSNYELKDNDNDGYLDITCANDLVYWYKNYNTLMNSNLELTKTLSLNDYYWLSIREFNGKFNGNYNSINNIWAMRITSDTSTPEYEKMNGLFSKLNTNAVVENLVINGSLFGTPNGNTIIYVYRCGGLVAGVNYGTIKNIVYRVRNNTSTKENIYGTSALKNAYFGGIVGINYGTIQNCINEKESYNSDFKFIPDKIENINNIYVGGVAGFSSGVVENCLVRCSINVHIGTYKLETNVIIGGIVGELENGTVSNCAYDNPEPKNSEFIYAYLPTKEAVVGGIVGVAEGTSKIEFCHNTVNEIEISEHNDYKNSYANNETVSLKSLYKNVSLKDTVTGSSVSSISPTGVVSDAKKYYGTSYTPSFTFGSTNCVRSLRYRYAGGIVGKAYGKTEIICCFSETATFNVSECSAYYTNSSNTLTISFKNSNIGSTQSFSTSLGSSYNSKWKNIGSISAYSEKDVTFTGCYAKENIPHITQKLSLSSFSGTPSSFYSVDSTGHPSTKYSYNIGIDNDCNLVLIESYTIKVLNSTYTIKDDKISISLDPKVTMKPEDYSTQYSQLTSTYSDNWVVKAGSSSPYLKAFYWDYNTKEPGSN